MSSTSDRKFCCHNAKILNSYIISLSVLAVNGGVDGVYEIACAVIKYI